MYSYTVTTEKDGIKFLTTSNWQEALDECSLLKSTSKQNVVINVFRDLENYSVRVKTLREIDEMSKHSEYLIFLESEKENRVTKRLVEQEYDGMEIVEPQESYDDFVRRAVKVSDYIADEEYELLSQLPDFHGDFESMSEEQQNDIINPKHYKMIPKEAYEKHPDGLEYMDLMEYILSHHRGVESHLLGQVFKYACRLGKKDADLQDARKIEWYANRLANVINARS